MELFGYAATIVVLISFLMKDMRKLRILSILGCVLFLIYGIYLHIIPTIIINIAVIIVNIYQLITEKKT